MPVAFINLEKCEEKREGLGRIGIRLEFSGCWLIQFHGLFTRILFR